MTVYRIKKGLSLPVKGAPSGEVIDMTSVSCVGILGDDYPNLKPSMLVKEGETVKKGQPVFTDRKNPSAVFTAIATGIVKAVHRGDKRKFLSLVIEKTSGDAVRFDTSYTDRSTALKLLTDSGLFTSLRRLPFAVVPHADDKPDAVFVNCMDTRPLAPDMKLLYQGNEEYFAEGMKLVKMLADKTYVCCAPDMKVADDAVIFDGIHPAGLTGTHVHFLRPVSMRRCVWTMDMQTVIDIGYLIKHKELNESKTIALSGACVKSPCHIKTVKGASIRQITNGRIEEENTRVINGSVLYGLTVSEETAYLSSVMNQVSVVNEQTDRPFMGWLMPGAKVHSVKNIFLSKILREKNVEFDTSMKGCVRAMVPVGIYEKVMPMDILPTHLLRALLVKDYETAEKLGCLELSEEDLSLCTYACPGKIDYAPVLRSALTEIEKEG